MYPGENQDYIYTGETFSNILSNAASGGISPVSERVYFGEDRNRKRGLVEFSWGYTKERKRKTAIFDSGENVSGRECIRERIRTIYIPTKPILTYLPMPLGEEFPLCLKGSILGTPEIGKGAWLSFPGVIRKKERKKNTFGSGENVSGRECIRERIRTIYIRTKPILTYLPMPQGEEFPLCLKGSILGTPDIGKGAWLSFPGVIRKKERKKRYIWLGRECIRERIRTIYIRTKPISTYLAMPLGEELPLCLKGSILGTPEIGKGAWLSFPGVIRKKEREKRRYLTRERMYPGENVSGRESGLYIYGRNLSQHT